MDTTDGELETRLRRAGEGLASVAGRLARLGLAAALARHVDVRVRLGEVGGGGRL